MMSRKTSLYDRHVALDARIVDFSGWLLPVQYEGVLSEHRHCRSAAVLFDTSHMGQFLFRGRDAAEQLALVGTQPAAALPIGTCRYGFLLDERAGVLDDTILMRLGERELLLVVNAGTAAGDLEWITAHLRGDVEAVDLSEQGWGKVDLQGPASWAVLSRHVEGDLRGLGYFAARRARCHGRDAVVSRTGYTGELGYEIMARSDDLAEIFDALLAEPEVKPAGLGARDSLRLEMSYPLYGHELSAACNPLEADLGRFAPDDGEYIGAKRLREIAAAGVSRKLVAFKADTRRRAAPGNEILAGGEVVGAVTSGAFSPSMEVSIGMGYVRPDLASPGTELTVKADRAELAVTVGRKPLYTKGTCRTKDL